MRPEDELNLEIIRRAIPESDVQAGIRDYLVMRGAVVIRLNSGIMPTPDGGRQFAANTWHAPGHARETRGGADLLVVFRGTAFAIEVKRPGGRQSQAQREFQAAWKEAGGWYILASSLDDVVQEIGE